jgi:acyl dehydratase
MTAPEVAPVIRQLNQRMIDLYAAASGDHNPIHTDVEFAKTTPMGGTIAHGMLVMATLSEMMTAAFGTDWLNNGALDVRFRSPARPGDVVTASAVFQKQDGDRLRYAVECRNDKDEVLITGAAEVAAVS